jgi:hypothetical protein
MSLYDLATMIHWLFEQAPTEGFENYVGNKTSMRLINAAWVQSYSRDVEHKGAKGKLTLEEVGPGRY